MPEPSIARGTGRCPVCHRNHSYVEVNGLRVFRPHPSGSQPCGTKQRNGSSMAESPAEASARSSEEQNQLVIWETTSGVVRELHLCEGHHRDLIGSLRLSGVGCSAVPSQQPCQVCENNGDWPDLTHTPGNSAATNEAT